MRPEAEKLTGTDEPPVGWRVLRTGLLSAELENGQLRYVRYDGVEVLRAISFLSRDRYWGTFSMVLSGMQVEETADTFLVRYEGQCAPDDGDLRFSVEIIGEAQGRLVFRASGAPMADFVTNRTGFVVLHPLEGVAGAEVELEHTGGVTETVALPERISPHEPAQDLFAITHSAGGLAVRVEMTGDAYDMEDQRNWTDASFKTYIRPLSKPKPYTMPAGERFDQSVTVIVSGATSAYGAEKRPVGRLGTVPRIGLATETAGVDRIELFGWVSHLVGRPSDPGEVEGMLALAGAIGAELELQFAIAAVQPEAELSAWAAAGRAHSVLVTPWGLWPLAPREGRGSASLDNIAVAARAAFPSAAIGGGVLTGFTEFNRNRPPVGAVDYVTHATTAIVHAADDRSVMESLEALPHVFRSARALGGGRPYRVGPATIGMALNPDGPPRHGGGARGTMQRDDPRQRGLFAAAWTLGYAARLIPFDVEVFTPGFLSGELGLIEDDGSLRPVYHVVRALALAAGETVTAVSELPDGSIGLRFAGSTWVANVSPVGCEVAAGGGSRVAVLDRASFDDAARNPAYFDAPRSEASRFLSLGPYAVARIWT
jgi:D-apionolactonase